MASPRTSSALGDRAAALLATPLGRGLLRALGLAVLLLVGGLIVRQARARVWRLEGYRLGPASIRYVGLHPALGPLVARALSDPRWIPLDVSVFDPAAEDEIREILARHPMVASVRSVEVRYPDRAYVRVVVREPAAWFEVRGSSRKPGYLLVSTDGCLLDPLCYEHYRRKLRVPLPKVRGVKAKPPELYGQAWEDLPEQVAEGIAATRVAARLYRDFNGTLSVKTIDVSAFPAPPARRRDGEIRLHLHDGTVVEWGRTERDLDGVAGEDPYETKRWRLETELNRPGRPRPSRIDVRFRLPGEGRARVRRR